MKVKKYQKHSPTSIAAAREIENDADTIRGRVYRYIRDRGNYGATDEEIQLGLGLNPSTQRPRRVELCDRGLVKQRGSAELGNNTRKTRSGRQAAIWVICWDQPAQMRLVQ